MRIHYLFFIAFPFFFISCNSTTTTQEDKATPPTATLSVISKLNDSATKQLTNLLTNYYVLKDALVASSAEKANVAAQTFATSIDNFSNVIKTDTAINKTVALYLDTIKTVTSIIITAKSNKIEEIRGQFAKISGPMFALCRKTELKNAGVYFQHCPMAFDTGANWLSNVSEIKNPYYGDKMLDCGDVADSLK